jgi:4-hydroxybenzoate polyprenyltransferase
MTWQTIYLYGHLDNTLLLFIFASTFCSYGFHAIVQLPNNSVGARMQWNQHNHKWLYFSTVVGGCISLYSALPYISFYQPFVLAGVATFLYSAPNLNWKPFIWLRSIAFGKTVYLALVWTYITTILPLWIQHQTIFSTTIGLFVCNRFLLVYAICILFDKRDRITDQIKGIKTLATVVNENSIRWTYYLSLMASLVLGLALGFKTHSLTNVVYFSIPPAIGLMVYQKSTRSKGLFYDLGLDGLMMLAAFLQLIHIIWLNFTF